MKYSCYAALLLLLGVAQMAGTLLHWPRLQAVAAATNASPAPKVFSAIRGLETFSSSFFLRWQTADGSLQHFPITPRESARLKGPYNRRNVYGAVLSYGPVLAADPRTRPMLDAVLRAAFGGEAPLLKELGVEKKDISGNLDIVVVPGESTWPEDTLVMVIQVPIDG